MSDDSWAEISGKFAAERAAREDADQKAAAHRMQLANIEVKARQDWPAAQNALEEAVAAAKGHLGGVGCHLDLAQLAVKPGLLPSFLVKAFIPELRRHSTMSVTPSVDGSVSIDIKQPQTRSLIFQGRHRIDEADFSCWDTALKTLAKSVLAGR
jgi:hypothetical protein